MKKLALITTAILCSTVAWSSQDTLRESQELYNAGQYFRAARYAFAAGEANKNIQPEALSWVTLGLAKAGLANSASYFFIRTLQSGQKPAIRRVLTQTESLLMKVGGDLLRKYLIRHTSYEDYDELNRSAYLYSLARDALLSGDEEKAIGYINGMSGRSQLWPYALQLRATAFSIRGKTNEALKDFETCANKADAQDLQARCQAGVARVLYELERFAEADQAYDRIRKTSIVWPDILFEQAWNAFAKQEYNRTLGRLVSYKSPALSFVFNTEVDVLRAQAYLALCLYPDANDVINEFNGKYARMGEDVKRFVESNQYNLGAFYAKGEEALRGPIATRNDFHRLLNRFVRGPYFQGLVLAERTVEREREVIKRFASSQPGVSYESGRGFPGFLDEVLNWRVKTVRMLGGAFVKNSLMDYHSALIADFEKMAFIKLEMLSRAKDKLLNRNASSSEARGRGNVEPSRRDDQYYWSFNGEFWNDELGDYVFGLESECGK